MGRDGTGQDGMEWERLKNLGYRIYKDGMGWDGMGWDKRDGMGWDKTGRDGTG